jgi:SulP family sulfate permease
MRYRRGAISRSVITGFVNALAILIFMAQLPQLTEVTWQAYAMVAGGLAIIYLLPRVTKAVPSPRVAILALTAISIATGAPVNSVSDMGALPEGLPSLTLPDVPSLGRRCKSSCPIRWRWPLSACLNPCSWRRSSTT